MEFVETSLFNELLHHAMFRTMLRMSARNICSRSAVDGATDSNLSFRTKGVCVKNDSPFVKTYNAIRA